MTDSGDESPPFDPEAVHAKYQAERAKRMVASRGQIRDLTGDDPFSHYRDDPFTPFAEREPVSEDVDVAIIGTGMSGLLAGAELRKVGVEGIRLIDRAGGVGGTWYWNRYPGVMCDVESYIYMPMLEEMNYIPKTRYAFGDEIREYFEAIAQKYDLIDNTLFHTGVEKSEWDEGSGRWVIRTDRGDEIRARFLIPAVGILNLMKLPVIPGMELFQGKSFHSARWDFEYTGGGPEGNLTNLGDKVVGIIGTGATAIQAIPHLAESAKHLYVFQRTPSAIGVRGNRPTPEDFAENLEPGWQRERMENFTAVMIGRPVDRDLTDDGWTHHMAKVANPVITPEMTPEEILLNAEEFDYSVMEEHRERVEELVSDPDIAEALKPYYRYLCKRPCFHDEYLDTFNRPNVTLVDCPAGVEQVTEHGVIANDTYYELDCIIYATGFEAEVTPFPRRAGYPIIGRGGVSLADKWKDGTMTLHGIVTRGFPNLFIMPAPGQQAVTTVSITHLNAEGAMHIAATVAALDKAGVKVFDVSEEAETDWVDTIVGAARDASAFMGSCTPSRLNFEGDPSRANPRNSSYGGGYGDFFGWQALLKEWRERGDFAGFELELDEPVDAVSGQRVVVVTGGAAGIGAAIAEEIGRTGAFVVTLDPVVALDGVTRVATADSEPTTAERIVAAGGAARASSTSVTDTEAVPALFAELVEEFGSLDAVVNVAGISRPTGFASGIEDDWAAVLSVHLDGYLNVLRSALPIMAAAGHGRILGVTSGSGWRAADAGAYSCAKRAVAALTWQIGRAAPRGVTVNALSPIAATRMVAAALSRQAADGNETGKSAASGGVALGAVPPPDFLAPVGAYLTSDEFSWCSGQVVYSVGSEVAVVTAPRPLEVARTSDVASFPHVLEELIPGAFAPAETAQATNGGGTPRFGPIFDEPATELEPAPTAARCVIVTDDAGWGAFIGDALTARGVECIGIGAGTATEIASGFGAVAEQLAGVATEAGPIDAVVVALRGTTGTGGGASDAEAWQQILAEHAGITENIRADAAWVRAVADYSAETDRPVRVVTVSDGTSAGGRSRGQAAAQLARAARPATADRVFAFAISVETSAPSERQPVAEVVAYLVCGANSSVLSGAELFAASGSFGLRSHPSPAGTITFGGPSVPDWLDDAMRSIVTVSSA